MGVFLRLVIVAVVAFVPYAMLSGAASRSGTSPLAMAADSGDAEAQRQRLTDAVRVLARTPSGGSLLVAVRERLNLRLEDELLSLFTWGDASKTDAVLTRRFNPRTGQESRDRVVTIHLKRSQPLEDLVLDIAHELTHASAGPTWDPYDPTLTAGRYIQTAIEGRGGEIDAMVAECVVGLELRVSEGASALRCASYVDETGTIDRERILKDLYRVGTVKRLLIRKLGLEAEQFPFLSEASPRLYSSTGRAPYPVALLREYEEITQIACDNSRRRLITLPLRGPASLAPYREMATMFINRRCEKMR